MADDIKMNVLTKKKLHQKSNGMSLSSMDILISGQLKTSRTETLENFLKKKANCLGVFGFLSPHAQPGKGRCTLYSSSKQLKEFYLPQFTIANPTTITKPLLIVSFIVNIFLMIFSVKRMKRKFDIFVGIATFSTLLGLLLKKIGRVDRVIYYCLDYYSGHSRFDKFICFLFRKLDAWAVKKVDMVWDISPRIQEARYQFAGVEKGSYERLVVPLGYEEGLEKNLPFEERERWTMGFVGTLSENQGLDMVIDSMPTLITQFPEIKVHIIGHGPDRTQLEQRVIASNLQDRITFHGFIDSSEEVNSILSRCMIGLATWTGGSNDHSVYADPGKPKLYALLGLPTIITTAPLISQLIGKTGAGEAIPYEKEAFISAVGKILKNEESFARYITGLEEFKKYCRAETIFENAFEKTLSTK